MSQFYQFKKVEGIISFSDQTHVEAKSYYFINNPDGSMRWLFPTKSISACFLNLYNGSGVKAFAFKEVAKKLSVLGWMKPITSGRFSIFSKHKKNIKHHFGKLLYDDFAIFTGTVGDDRKMVVALSKNKICNHFVKIPLTSAAERLVENEFQMLDQLSDHQFEELVFPKTKPTPTGIVVSNVQPTNAEKNNSFQKKHLMALEKLYQISAKEMSIKDIAVWKTIERGLKDLKTIQKTSNKLPIEKIKQLSELCQSHYKELSNSKEIIVGIGHGDFTPWNMYQANGKLHLYDWEMANLDTPLLLSLIHI